MRKRTRSCARYLTKLEADVDFETSLEGTCRFATWDYVESCLASEEEVLQEGGYCSILLLGVVVIVAWPMFAREAVRY